MSNYNLRAVVIDVLSSTSASDPRDIASMVMARIPDDLSRVALQVCITSFVRQIVSERRMLVPLDSLADVAGSPARQPNRSVKVAAIREAWRQQLENCYECGEGRWKRLGDMGPADLAHAASVRREMARKNDAKAAYLEALADLVRTHGVSELRDLPDAVLASALGGVA